MEVPSMHVSALRAAVTPSRVDGVTAPAEALLRVLGCELVEEAGIRLRLPQVAMATAQVYLHRFFSQQSLMQHDVREIAAACLFLSAKVEEVPRPSRDIVSVFYQVIAERDAVDDVVRGAGRGVAWKRPEPLNPQGEAFREKKERLVSGEKRVLKEMGFSTRVEHHHKFLLNYLQVLGLTENTLFVQRAWNTANDLLRTYVCVRFPPETLAAATVYLTARQLQVALPVRAQHEWWRLFDVPRLDDMEEVCRAVLLLYRVPRVRWFDPARPPPDDLASAWAAPVE